MLDMKLVRENPGLVQQALAKRHGGDEAKITALLARDEERRTALAEAERLKARRNALSKEVGQLMAQRKLPEAEAAKAEVRALAESLAANDAAAAAAEAARDELMLTLPNLPHASVPEGRTSADNPVVRSWGASPKFDFTPQNHTDLCLRLGLVDFARGAKLTGSGFLLYTHRGARLERALINFLLDLHTREHGYTEMSPPFLVGEHCMFGVGQFPKFRDQAYAVREGLDDSSLGKLYLVPTAEAPIANVHREEVLAAERLPVRYAAYSPCFRAEAGAAGVGTRGMIRVHQFDKVELIKIVRPEDGYAELESMVANAETVLQRLGLSYHVIALCGGDMGFASAKTYDIEVWAPGQNQFLEVSSCSNCEEFQARRMNLRYKTTDGGNRFPHILNGSGTALARLYVALLETHQRADGSVAIPPALQPYYHEASIEPAGA